MARELNVRDEMGLILNYRDLRKKQPTLEGIQAILGGFAVDDWLCQLGRLACLLGGDRSRSPEWIRHFLRWFTPAKDKEKVNSWFREHAEKGETAVVPSERHVGILAELAVLHAPDSAERKMEFPGDEGAIFDALLMVAALDTDVEVPPQGETAKDAAERFMSLWFRSGCPWPMDVVVRGFTIYQILQGKGRSPKGQEWAELFKEATGLDIDEYFSGGFISFAECMAKSAEDLASGWSPVPEPKHFSNNREFRTATEAYGQLRVATIEELRKTIRSLENIIDIGAYNLIALKKYPLVRCRGGVYPLYLQGIASSLSDGIYHAAITAALDKAKTFPLSPQDVGSAFGYLYERYVLDVLEERFADRLIRNPVQKKTGNEAADALLMCPNGLVAFQVKGCHTPEKWKFVQRKPGSLDELFEAVGLEKAVKQIVRTAEMCRSGEVEGLPDIYGQPDTVMQPIILTYERIPEFSLLQSSIDEWMIRTLDGADVRRPILMGPEDLGCIVSLPTNTSLWQVTSEYIASLRTRPQCFFNFLGNRRYADKTALEGQFDTVRHSIAEHLGILEELLKDESDNGSPEPQDGAGA